ncbi:hypothetical protein [Couchioplanes caeruleus]|uniref:Fibronectin type-III domain-containing protein n=2 Tax=Couchioplanes caeruleus TaxID=56438 RepID=A0A1K0GTG4_9ACTN|nr:hypothetical protein [Couchioplanes caeruleus]OJF12571.1 hypothetical protein BG844_20020 [Couchioplanes caeruleus subsp. caeruleus]ROP30602.1 hypothetical protein EDD30_3460 [Couchioplanes caeruleus]
MRLFKFLVPVLAVPFALSGCGALGLGSATGTPSASETPVPGDSWIVVAAGSPTATPKVSYSGSRPPALPPVSFLPAPPGDCAKEWTVDPVHIPMEVTPGAGKLTVTWPRQYSSAYRITAVDQTVVSGTQPPYVWQDVPAGDGCTVTATISGLSSKVPYVVWLDAPDTGYQQDGTRHPYSGRSGVVYPL